MKKEIVTVYDSKSESWSPITLAETKAAALRMFSLEVNNGDAKSLLTISPADFDLFTVGTFDSETGKVEGYKSKIHIANGIDVKTKQEVANA